jgi:hypothetical protein
MQSLSPQNSKIVFPLIFLPFLLFFWDAILWNQHIHWFMTITVIFNLSSEIHLRVICIKLINGRGLWLIKMVANICEWDLQISDSSLATFPTRTNNSFSGEGEGEDDDDDEEEEESNTIISNKNNNNVASKVGKTCFCLLFALEDLNWCLNLPGYVHLLH